MSSSTKELDVDARHDVLTMLRSAIYHRARAMELLFKAEEIIGSRAGIDDLIDHYASDVASPVAEADMDLALPNEELTYFLELKED